MYSFSGASVEGKSIYFGVLENRALGRGRTIDLNLVLLPSLGPATLPPIFDIDGGPGLPATKNFQFYATEGAAYRQGRDIVLVDQRGTGGSNPLACPDLAATPPNAPMLPVDGTCGPLQRSVKLPWV